MRNVCDLSYRTCLLCNHSFPSSLPHLIHSKIQFPITIISIQWSCPSILPVKFYFLSWSSQCLIADHLKLWFWFSSKWKKVKLLSRVRLFATPRTVAYQAPLSIGFSRQGYWSGLPFPSPRDHPKTGIEPGSPALQADTLSSEPPEKPGFLEGISHELFLPFQSDVTSNPYTPVINNIFTID